MPPLTGVALKVIVSPRQIETEGIADNETDVAPKAVTVTGTVSVKLHMPFGYERIIS